MAKLSKLNIFDKDWVELVFQGRNQTYGAYVLRKQADKNTNRGILFAILFFTLIITTPKIIDWIKGLSGPKEKDVKVTQVTTLEEPPPVDKNQPPPPAAEPPPPLKSTVKFTPPEIKPDQEVPDEPPPTQDDMKDKDAGTQTVEGDANGVDLSLIPTGNGDGVTGEAEPEILTFAEQPAEFNGDVYEWLGNNLNYPDMAKQAGVEGKVNVEFVVNEDGSISDVKAVGKKANWGFDESAVEAVKRMPKWKPAKQNGKAARLRMTIPIKFQLQ
ncbi:MAG: energy transducer TonB [Bacteroidia bacterium]|jgi:periplasmic protein TonB|nr:energy transducer TonB [Bacteroidia bacterium]